MAGFSLVERDWAHAYLRLAYPQPVMVELLSHFLRREGTGPPGSIKTVQKRVTIGTRIKKQSLVPIDFTSFLSYWEDADEKLTYACFSGCASSGVAR